MWEEEIEFVKKTLIKNNGNDSPRSDETFRKRNEHCVRVLNWSRRIVSSLSEEERNKLDIEALELASIFHDVGYGVESFKNSHGIEGSEIFKQYAIEHNFDKNLIDKVVHMIYVHQDKTLLERNISEELKILMEADMMDEEGSLAICWDLLTLGRHDIKTFKEALDKIESYSAHILTYNPMKHKYAIKEWEKKQNLIKEFIYSMRHDLFLD